MMRRSVHVGVCRVASLEEGAKLDTDARSSAWPMMNDISFATCPKHGHAQQAPTKYRSARAGIIISNLEPCDHTGDLQAVRFA
jgi:hypothetical protein